MLIAALLATLVVVTEAPEAPAASAQETPSAAPSSWGGFRGPGGGGHAERGGLPDALDVEDGVLWSAEVPAGYSSPVAVDGRVFVTGADETHLVTVCLDEATGRRMWHRRLAYDGKRPGANSSAAPTPATDGERVFALFHHAGLVAYDLFGEELWRNGLGAPFNIPHGLATSPVVHDGRVVLQLDQDSGSALVCLDAATGEALWTTARDGASHSYATPAVHVAKDGSATIIVSGSYEIAGYSMESGERLWWVTGSAWQSKSVPLIEGDVCIVSAYMPGSTEFGLPPTPANFEDALADHDADGNGRIGRSEWEHEMLQQTWFIWDKDGDEELDADDYAYLLSTKTERGALFAIRLGGSGDVTDSHVAWKYDDRRGLSDVVSPILMGGQVFLLKDGGLMTAIDAATGEVGEDGRLGEPDQYFASPVGAGNRILAASMSGQLTVIDAGPGEDREWKVVSTSVLDAGRIWSTPALTDGRILVRGSDRLVCLERPR